jgi:hypothetical protein
VSAGVSGWQFRACQKGGEGVGTTKGGKGSKVMVVAEGNDLPIGLYVDSDRPHESQLAEATLATVRVPRNVAVLATTSSPTAVGKT